MRAALWYKAKDMRVEEIPTPVAPQEWHWLKLIVRASVELI